MKLLIGIIVWMSIGIYTIFWEVNVHQGRDIKLGEGIIVGLSGAALGPIATVIMVGVHVTDNWNTVIVEGKSDRKEK